MRKTLGVWEERRCYLPFPRSRVSDIFAWLVSRATCLLSESLALAMNRVYAFSLIIHNFVWQGTAAFWYNLLKSGEPDASTLHAACPVIVGTKWGGYTYSSMTASGFLLRRGFFVSRRTGERKKFTIFGIDHNAPCLLRLPLIPPHQKKCITIVFDSSWDDCNCNT